MSRPITAPEPLQLASLQSLRGIAAVIVLLRHATLSYPIDNGPASFLLSVLFNAHAAVVVFFVLSGFVLSLSLERRQLSWASLSGFYIKRGFRVLPLLMVITVLSIGYTISPFARLQLAGGSAFFAGLLQYGPARPSVVILSLFGMNSHYVPQNWTIMVELLIAPLFPFLFFASRTNWRAFAALYGAALLASFAARSGGHWLPVVYAEDFLLGIFVQRIWTARSGRGATALVPLTIAATLLLVMARPLLDLANAPWADPNNFHDPLTSMIEALAAAAVVFGLASNVRLKQAMSHPWPVFLGNVSYSLYLVHFLVLVAVARLLDQTLPHFNLLSLPLRSLSLSAAVLAISLGLAAALYQVIEMPFNRFGRRLAVFDITVPAAPVLGRVNLRLARPEPQLAAGLDERGGIGRFLQQEEPLVDLGGEAGLVE